jgi:hypothetical protein
MSKLKTLVNNLLHEWDIEIAELQSILAIIILSASLLLGLTSPSSPLYLVTPKIFGFEILALAAFAISILHLGGLAFGNTCLRRWSSLAQCALWTYLTVSIWRRHDTFALVSVTFILSSGLVYLRLTRILERLQKRSL